MTAIESLQSFLGIQWQTAFLCITYLGSDYAYIVLLSFYYWLVDPILGRQLGILLGITYALNISLKELTDRPRPFELDPTLARLSIQKTAEGASFPSGHAQGSATFWFYLAGVYPYPWLWIFSVILVSLVALSRVYLGVHFLGDVIAGILVGTSVAWCGLCWQIPARKGWKKSAGLVAITVIISVLLPKFARALAVLVGFFISQLQFTPPTTWKNRVIFAVGGVVIVLLYYVASGWLFNENMSYWRYLLLTLLVTEGCPRLAQRSRLLN
jgi:membrane-associated phospholipid phosphatase